MKKRTANWVDQVVRPRKRDERTKTERWQTQSERGKGLGRERENMGREQLGRGTLSSCMFLYVLLVLGERETFGLTTAWMFVMKPPPSKHPGSLGD